MSRWPLRRRVALAAAVSIVLALAGLGIGVQLLLARQLRGALDDTLRARAADVARLSASAPALLTRPGVLEATIGPQALDIEVVDRRGLVVARSLSLGGSTLDAPQALRRALHDGRAVYADTALGGRALRLLAAPLADVGGGPAAGGAVIVAAPTAEISTTLRRLRMLIVAGGALAAIVAAAAATVLTRRALGPLERLTDAAAGVEATGDPSRRLPGSGTRDEVGRLAETLNRMLAALEEASERERRFVADASHELRTPLTALRGNIDYLVRHGDDADALADLHADADRLSRLVDDLLMLAREDSAAPPARPVRLDELAAEVAQGADARLEATGPVWVRGDAGALERALRNLVENAHRHGPAGGLVTVCVTADGAEATASVSDEGAGLPVPLEQAAQRFWRGAATRAGGSGLGLSLVAATARRHGGALRADGSTISLVLPALRHVSDERRITPVVTEREDLK